MPVIKGIDVSNHQDRIDWSRVKADGISFAYVKASEGQTFVDPKYDAHVAGAKSVGIKTGAITSRARTRTPPTRSRTPAPKPTSSSRWRRRAPAT